MMRIAENGRLMNDHLFVLGADKTLRNNLLGIGQ